MTIPARVLVVTHTGQIGGAERALLRLIGAADERFEISLLTLADGALAAEARSSAIPVRVLPGGDVVHATRADAGAARTAVPRALDALRLAGALRRAIIEASPDLVVANSLKAAVLVGLVSRPRRRWVWHLHDRIAPDYLPSVAVSALRALARWGPRRVIANSAATAATIGGAGGRVVVAYPGVERALFDAPAIAREAASAGLVGRVSETKGQVEFVRAAEIVARARPRTAFRIVGAPLFEDGPYAERLRARIEASPVEVEWSGWTNDPAGELQRLGVLVHASPVPEPFGQVIVEAMALGTPVVATDAGGVSEIVDPAGDGTEVAPGVRRGRFGLLVPPGDPQALARAILLVQDDPEDAAARAADARASARERFAIERTWDVVAKAWADAIGASGA